MSTFCTTTSLDILMVDTEFDTATTALASSLIIDAENEIRKRLSKRYDVSSASFQTSTSIPPMVTTLCECLSLGYMYENLSRDGKDAYARSDRFLKKAFDNMDAIVDYKANLLNSAGSSLSESTESLPMYSTTKDYHDTFAEDDALKWGVDGDKLNAISTERDT